MKKQTVVISTFLLSLFALLWNGLVHLVILRDENKAIEFIHRPDMADKLWISILITVIIVMLFTVSYLKWRKDGTIIESIRHSTFFALLMIVVVDLNQYVQYEIPFSLILKWSSFGVVEFIIYGLLIYFIFKQPMPMTDSQAVQ